MEIIPVKFIDEVLHIALERFPIAVEDPVEEEKSEDTTNAAKGVLPKDSFSDEVSPISSAPKSHPPTEDGFLPN